MGYVKMGYFKVPAHERFVAQNKRRIKGLHEKSAITSWYYVYSRIFISALV